MNRPYRLGYLVSHPIQYQAPLLRHIAAHPEIDLTVFFLSDLSVREYQDSGFGTAVHWDVPLLDGYKHIFLQCLGGHASLSFWRPFVYGLGEHLKTGQFDALWIHGYAHQANLWALLLAKRLSLMVLMRGESHLNSNPRYFLKTWAKDQLFPTLFKLIDGFLAIGSLNRRYYFHYDVPEERIFSMPYAVDNDFFQKKAEEARPYRERMRAELGLQPGRPVVLYASKFMKRKRPRDLMEAYIRLSPDGTREPASYLLFIGGGEQRPELEAQVRALGWSSVRFLGFKNQTELPGYYDLCDVFVLPSEYEPWGLVVNEVMNAGKPVIVSEHVGCGPDLVRDSENGFIVPLGNVEVLTDRLRRLTTDPELAKKMGETSQKIISTWNFDADVKGLLQALYSIVGSKKS
jgi:glycosyltransferase involved in cell wall biosynthesis